MSYRDDLNKQKALTISIIKFHNTFFGSNVTKVSDKSSRINFPDFNYAFPEKYIYKSILIQE